MRRVDLCEACGGEEWQGWVIGRDGVLYAPDTWRRGFSPHELRALFFQAQAATSYARELDQARKELAQMETEKAAALKRAAFYRRQCVAEAQLGLCLSRLSGGE